jgi:uncharacterized protein (DUF1697 family)
MPTNRYVALLRGINVGGRNKVAMADLREMFEEHGFGAVSTYIQSGNVLFESDAPRSSLEGDVETMLEHQLGIPLMVVVRSHIQLRNVVDKAPSGFGTQPDEYHCDAVFLKPPLTAPRTMEIVELRQGVDRAWAGSGVVYFERLSTRRSQSRMSRIVSTPEYGLMTIRSWRTTTRLLELLDARRDD